VRPGEATRSRKGLACGRPRIRTIASTVIFIFVTLEYIADEMRRVQMQEEPCVAIMLDLFDVNFGALTPSVVVTPRRYRLPTSWTWLGRAWLTCTALPRRVYQVVFYKDFVNALWIPLAM
jgi:hypothetical protein